VPQVGEHYASILDEMRAAPGSPGVALSHSRSEPPQAPASLCHSPLSRRPRHATALGDCVVWEASHSTVLGDCVVWEKDAAADLDAERFDVDKVEAMHHCGPLRPGEMLTALLGSPKGSEAETCAPPSSGSRGSRSNFSDFEHDLEKAPSVNRSAYPRPGAMMCGSPKAAGNDGEVHPPSLLLPPSSINRGIAEEKQPLLPSHHDQRWAAGKPLDWAWHRQHSDDGVCGLLGHLCPGASWEDSMRRLRDHHDEFGAAFVHWALPMGGFNGLQQVQQGMITFGKPL